VSAAVPLRSAPTTVAPLGGTRLSPSAGCACGAAKSPLTGECSACRVTPKRPLAAPPARHTVDESEQEAERIAEQVTSGVQDRAASAPPIRALPRGAEQQQEAPASVAETLSMAGSPLSPALRKDMEQRFGRDFSSVRVHVGPVAARSANDMGADAYTVGRNIVFGAGKFSPASSAGRRLLAHELTHVLQQSAQRFTAGATSLPIQRSPSGTPAAVAPDVDPAPAPDLGPVGERLATKSAPPGPPRNRDDVQGEPQRAHRKPVTALAKGGNLHVAPEPEVADADAAAEPTGAVVQPQLPSSPMALPRLADLLPAEGPTAPVAGTLDAMGPAPRDDFTAATANDLKLFVAALREAKVHARQRVAGHASQARAELSARSKQARGRVADQIKRADAAVVARIGTRRAELERTVTATATSIDWQRDVRQKEAETRGFDAKLTIAETVRKQRGKIERAIENWAGYADTLRDFHIKRVEEAVEEHAQRAVHQAELYDRRLISAVPQSAARAAVQREASSTLAAALAAEFRKTKPDLVQKITDVTAQIGGQVREYGTKVLAKFDETLPTLLNSIDEQVIAAKQEIANRATRAHTRLAMAAAELNARLDFLETDAQTRNAAVGTALDRQIAAAEAQSDRRYDHAVAQIMRPIGSVVQEAIEILTGAAQLDLDASWQFVGEVIAFTRDAAEDSQDLFKEVRAGLSSSLNRPAAVARRSLRAVDKELARVLREEGMAAELALATFETDVDDYYAESLTMLDETFAAANDQARTLLAPFAHDVYAALEKAVMDAAPQLRQAVNDALYEQVLGLRRLPREMHNAARQAAWRFDHPHLKKVVAGVEWVLEALAVIFVAIAVILALVLAFEAIVAVLAALLGELLAQLLVTAIGAFAAGYFGAKAYDERVKKGQSGPRAFFGAIADVTGISDFRKALTDDSLGILERGVLLGTSGLAIFGLAMGAARVFKFIRLRFPTRLTDPHGLVPVPGETPGFKTPAIEPPAQSPRIEGFGRGPEPVEPAPPADAPLVPSKRVQGFGRGPEPVEPAPPADAPLVPSKRVRGFGRGPEPIEPVPAAEPPVAAPARTDLPSARELPSVEPGGGAQGARASAAGPREPAGTPPAETGTPVKGTLDVVPPAAAPPETPAALPAKEGVAQPPKKSAVPSRRASQAASRAAEADELAEKMARRVAKAKADLEAAERNLAEAKTLRAEQPGDRDVIDELVTKHRTEAARAKAEVRNATKAEKAAASEARDVSVAQDRISRIEEKIAEIDRQMHDITRDPELTRKFGPREGQRPPSSTKQYDAYQKLGRKRTELLEELADRTEDLTRSLTKHARGVTPGEPGKVLAKENLEQFPALQDENGVPLDVTTGEPIQGDDWVADHLVSRSKIASDPRYRLLTRAGRREMLSDIKENLLPITPEANSSKLDRSVNEWLMARARAGKPIDAELARSLRAAEAAAKEAIDQRFNELLAAMGQ
jgi:hypothetical protein